MGALAAILMAYPLSFGPAARIADHWESTIPFVSVFYRPVIRLALKCGGESGREVIYWYCMEVWGAGKIVDHRFVQEALR